jgi:hypothetical protein
MCACNHFSSHGSVNFDGSPPDTSRNSCDKMAIILDITPRVVDIVFMRLYVPIYAVVLRLFGRKRCLRWKPRPIGVVPFTVTPNYACKSSQDPAILCPSIIQHLSNGLVGRLAHRLTDRANTEMFTRSHRSSDWPVYAYISVCSQMCNNFEWKSLGPK